MTRRGDHAIRNVAIQASSARHKRIESVAHSAMALQTLQGAIMKRSLFVLLTTLFSASYANATPTALPKYSEDLPRA